VVEGIVDDVLEGVGVLLLRLDRLRPEAPAEDVVAAAMALVEGPGVAAVEVTHAFGEIRHRRLDDEVIMVAQEAAHMDPPAVAPCDPSQDMDEEDAISVVEDDRRLVVAPRRDVVVGAGCEVAAFSAHPTTVAPARAFNRSLRAICHRSVAAASRARHRTGLAGLWPGGTGLYGTCRLRRGTEADGCGDRRRELPIARYAATLERSRCWCEGQ
jgi:hypothetical protein